MTMTNPHEQEVPLDAPDTARDAQDHPGSTRPATQAATATSPPTSPTARSAARNPFDPSPHPGAADEAFDAAEPALPPRPQEPPHDARDSGEPAPTPEVASLKAMFPDFDPIVLQSVLDSAGGNQDRAIDMLLGMSDPDYVSQEPAARERTQTELDEELARNLMLEDQHQPHGGWDPRNPGERFDRPPRGNVPYQPRVHQQGAPGQGQWGAQGQGQAAGRDTMTEVQEQFSKIAETGKKTFSSLVTKVKAKMQEYDQSRTAQGPSGQSGQSSWGGGPVGGGQPPQAHGQDPYGQQSYYDPNARGYDAAPAPARGYQAFPASAPQQPPAIPTNRPIEPTGTAGAPQIPRTPSPLGASGTPRPPSTTSGAPASNIDPSKIGLLPKRPVSLIGASPQTSHTGRPGGDDEDELDYVENPFEEEDR